MPSSKDPKSSKNNRNRNQAMERSRLHLQNRKNHHKIRNNHGNHDHLYVSTFISIYYERFIFFNYFFFHSK
jgi:hypothetical protein